MNKAIKITLINAKLNTNKLEIIVIKVKAIFRKTIINRCAEIKVVKFNNPKTVFVISIHLIDFLILLNSH